jgi:hypothetical protein
MPTPEEIARYIRFSLDNLSEVNGHYEFEHLCRHLARARIASNVIPATGPVGAGGDQGRDLETFRTYLSSELGSEHGFLALAADETIVIACTTQKTNLSGKIRSDVSKIMGSGSAVHRIYALLSNDFPVGTRHETSDWARSEFQIELEILDAQWIAQELSSSDTFWIAENYLSIPAEFAPPHNAEDIPEWYGELLRSWRDRTPIMTLGDLLSVKDGLRHATFNSARRPDLPFWLSVMRTFLQEETDIELVRRSEYEISVATLRGTGSLTPVDGLVSRYLEGCSILERPVDLENAFILLMYAFGAYLQGVTRIPPERLAEWNRELRDRIEVLLNSTLIPNSRAMLLRTLGSLYLQPDLLQMIDPDDQILNSNEESDELTLDREAGTVPLDGLPPFVNLDLGLSAWSDLMQMVDEAPFFPVESFADSFAVVTPLIYAHQSYGRLSELIDDRLSQTVGRTAAASKCRDRAVALHRAGMTCAAIKEFHRAKIGWWSGDTLRGSLLSLMILSNCYKKLGLFHAAKQYALQAARTASRSDDDGLQDLFAAGIMHCVLLCYDLGEWASAASTAESALRLHANLVAPLDPEDERVTEVMYSLLWIHLSSLDVAPELAAKVKNLMVEAHMWDDVEELVREQDAQPPEHWLERIGDQIHGEWMSDLKQEVRIVFKIYGTIWKIAGKNDLPTSCAVQRLAAALQIFLVDFFDEDLALLEEVVTIQVTVSDQNDASARLQPSTNIRAWEVHLTPWNGAESVDIYRELLPMITMILGDISLLPADQFFERFERSMSDGLVNKLSMGTAMDVLLLWVRDDSYDEIRFGTQLTPAMEDSRCLPLEDHELKWRSRLGPTYDRDSAEEQIQSRYDQISTQFSFTLGRLNANHIFINTLNELKLIGWLDWHILLAIANVAINYRLVDRQDGLRLLEGEADEYEGAVRAMMSADETESDPIVPESEFSIRGLESAREMTLPLFLRNVGLEVHQTEPDLMAVQKFLTIRYRYWLDDVTHENPFVVS